MVASQIRSKKVELGHVSPVQSSQYVIKDRVKRARSTATSSACHVHVRARAVAQLVCWCRHFYWFWRVSRGRDTVPRPLAPYQPPAHLPTSSRDILTGPYYWDMKISTFTRRRGVASSATPPAPRCLALSVRLLASPLSEGHPCHPRLRAEGCTRDPFVEVLCGVDVLVTLGVFSGHWVELRCRSSGRSRAARLFGSADVSADDVTVLRVPSPLAFNMGLQPNVSVVEVTPLVGPPPPPPRTPLPGAGSYGGHNGEDSETKSASVGGGAGGGAVGGVGGQGLVPHAESAVMARVYSPESDGRTSYVSAIRSFFSTPRVLHEVRWWASGHVGK